MTRFNRVVKEAKTLTTNRAGGEAYEQSTELELVGILLTSFLQDQYYRSGAESANELSKIVQNMPDKLFVAKAAVYARKEFGMRSVSHLVAAEIGKLVKEEQWTKRFFQKVVKRPDDIAEILSCYLSKYKKPIPNSMKKGLGAALASFDAYALAKYKGENHDLKLVDIVNLIHPRPSERSKDALAQLVKDELKSFDTWESKLTEAGQKAESEDEKSHLKAEAWRELITDKKIGYFALLRNLRNIAKQAPDILDSALILLKDRDLIKKSLVLPFRFITAAQALERAWADGTVTELHKVMEALNEATGISLDNVPDLAGRTLVALDDSGSMTSHTRTGGETPQAIGSLFAAVLFKKLDADVLQFSDNARYQALSRADSVMGLTHYLMQHSRGCGTNFHSIFETLNKSYDRIFILSDMQGWMEISTPKPVATDWYGRPITSSFRKVLSSGMPAPDYGTANPRSAFETYKQKYNCSPRIYSWDLQGYGTLMFPEQNVVCLAGFSDKVFDLIQLCEGDRSAMINKIKEVEI